MQGFHELITGQEMFAASRFLLQAGLEIPDGFTYALGYFDGGVLKATGFLIDNILCGIMVSPDCRGEGIAVSTVDRLVHQANTSGFNHLLLFTKPGESAKFLDMGFAKIAACEEACLLEWGKPDYSTWLQSILDSLAEKHLASVKPRDGFACIVMNANPFTMGHRYLVETALQHRSHVLVFVVQEDASAFPFTVRHRLVRQGLENVDGVSVLPGGPYLVSRASFPSYFTGKSEHSRVHAELDCHIFAERIAPDLGITLRVVGEEPLCMVTAAYNKAMLQILLRNDINCLEVPRLKVDGIPVSASTVRAHLQCADTIAIGGDLPQLVPSVTMEFLLSPAAIPIMQKIRSRHQRH